MQINSTIDELLPNQ